MRLLFAATLLAVPGCNQVFGIDETVVGVPCWAEAQSEFDEDADGVVDGCDICPGVADAMQLDEDGDHVGDECDPHLAEPIDRIVYFDGFSLPTLDPRWVSFGSRGAWEQADGDLSQTVVDGFGTLILQEVFDNATAEVVMSGQMQNDLTMFTSQGVLLRISPDDQREFPESIICFSYFEPTATNRRLLVVEDQPAQAIKNQTSFTRGERTLLRATSSGDCAGRVDEMPFVSTALTMELPPVVAHIGLRATRTVARFHSVTVYATDR